MIRSHSFSKWTAKCLMSSRGHLVAVSQFGCCSILDPVTGKVKTVVHSPIEGDKYPLMPLAFCNDDEALVCRINYDRILILYSLVDPDTCVTLKNVGGTISDATAVTADGKRLVCWPYGSIEVITIYHVLC